MISITHGLRAGFAVALALCGAARADEPVRTECFEGENVIFTSSVADIGAFDAEAYGASILQTIPMPADNAVFYQFGPRDIFCIVMNE